MTEIYITYEGDLSTRCVHSDNHAEILTDAPKDVQGQGRVFSPTDLFAASLGSCMLTLMGMSAKRLNLDLKGTRCTVDKELTKAPPRKIAKLRVVIACPQDFPEETRAKLIQAAETCPVHKSLHPDIILDVVYQWGQTG